MVSVLDLPIAELEVIAKRNGMTIDEYRAHINKQDEEIAAYEESIKGTPISKKWQDPLFIDRVHSETPN